MMSNVRPTFIGLSSLGASALVLGLAFASCSSDECETHLDCVSGEECIEGACTPKVGGGYLPADVGPRDVGGSDVGPQDDASLDAADGGVGEDGGDAGLPDSAAQISDASDGGVMGDASGEDGDAAIVVGDGSVLGDASAPDGGDGVVLPNHGLVWARQLFLTSVRGSFIDRSNARFTVDQTAFELGTEGRCVLSVEHLRSGTYAGYGIDRLEVTTSNTFGTLMLTLTQNTIGDYASSSTPAGLFDGTRTTAVLEIVPALSSPQNPIEAASLTTEIAPNPDILSPVTESIVRLPGDVAIQWTANASNGPLIVELADRYREVRLTCTVTNDGSFSLPSNASAAWVAKTPLSPYWLDVRHDRESTTTVGPDDLDVTFRTSRGMSYSVIYSP
ncbi:MAG: hypothetical protein IPK13_11235 [Deltaproteobacteria bacterium]|nr:hypothetical protein [Deltaproteobacteria bacterium]